MFIIIIIELIYGYEAFGENNKSLFFAYWLFSRMSPLKVFLFVLLLLQKPLISEIIAIVD